MSAGVAKGGLGQGILTLTIKDKATLFSSYMPYLKSGGLFVPTPKRYALGAEVFVMLVLPDSSERVPVAGKIVWVTPAGAQGGRQAGVGVQFGETDEGITARGKIEALLAGQLEADKPTSTM